MHKNVIIVGSGASIRQGLWGISIQELPIWKAIKKENTISLNWSHKWMNPTILMYADPRFYCTEHEKIKNHPLIIGREDGYYKRENISIPSNLHFVSYQFCNLCGEQAIQLSLKLGYKKIFILGYDGCESEGRTHFYQGDEENTGIVFWDKQIRTGVGKNEFGRYNTGIYNTNSFEKQYDKFLDNKDRIINVSEKSRIHQFQKMSYDEFYECLKLNRSDFNIEKERNEIKEYIKLKY